MAVAALSPTRALREPRRLDVRAVVGLLLMLLTVVGAVAFWSAASDTRDVLLATRDLPAGATLGPGDLTVGHVRVDDATYGAAISADQLQAIVGKPLGEPVHAHQLLVRQQLSSRPALQPGQLALTVPVSPATAAGGRIRTGDLVQVLVTTSKGKPESKTSVVLPSVTVYDIGFDQRSTIVNTSASSGSDSSNSQGSLSTITLVVTPEQALQLSQARWNGDLDAALLPPEEH